MKEKIKKTITILFLLLGVGLFVYTLFGFQSGYYCGEGEELPPNPLPMPSLPTKSFKCINPVVYYFYSDNDKILLALGTILITLGLIIDKNKKSNSE